VKLFGVGLERGMLPLLDISLMLLGLMIVVTVARSEAEEGRRSVWAGRGVVLLELAHEGEDFLVYAVEAESGRRVGAGRALGDAGDLVGEVLADADRDAGATVVILRGADPLAMPRWRIDHSAALRESLADHSWHIVW